MHLAFIILYAYVSSLYLTHSKMKQETTFRMLVWLVAYYEFYEKKVTILLSTRLPVMI